MLLINNKRNNSKTSINVDYDKFINSTQYNIMRNVRSLRSYVRSKRDVRGYPRVMTYGDSSADCLVDIANLFASYF